MRTLLLTMIGCTAIHAAEPAKPFDVRRGNGQYHSDAILSVAIAIDGSWIATGGTDGTVLVRDAKSLAVLHTLAVKDGIPTALVPTADGKQLLANFGDRQIRAYDATTFKLVRAIPANFYNRFSATADGKFLGGSEDANKGRLLEASTGTDRMDLPDSVAVAIAPDGETVAISDADSHVRLFAVPSGKPGKVFKQPKDSKLERGHLSWSRDGKLLAAAGDGPNSIVAIYDPAKDDPVLSVPGEGPIQFVGAERIAYRRDGRVILHGIAAKKITAEIGESIAVYAVSPDGKSIASDGGKRSASARLRLWDVETKTERPAAKEPRVGFRSTLGNADHPHVLVAGSELLTWSIGSDGFKTLLKANGSILSSAAADHRLFWSTPTGVHALDTGKADAKAIELPGFASGAANLATNKDGTLLAAVVGSAKPELVLCDGTGGQRRSWPISAAAYGLAASDDGRTVFAALRDGSVKAWDASSDAKAPILRWTARSARGLNGVIALSPDGQSLAIATMTRIAILDAKTGKGFAAIERTWDDGPFVAIAFSHDGLHLAASTTGLNSLFVYNIEFKSIVKRWNNLTATPWDVRFDRDGRTLNAVSSSDVLEAYDITGRRGAKVPDDGQLSKAWLAFGHPDDATAWKAAWDLRDGGSATSRLIAAKWSDIEAGWGKIDELIAGLASTDFAEREKASKGLLAIGQKALPALRKIAADDAVNDEQKQRAERAIATIEKRSDAASEFAAFDDTAAMRRAVPLLARLGDRDAKALLEKLAKRKDDLGKAAAIVLPLK